MFFCLGCFIEISPVLCQICVIQKELLVRILECLQFSSRLNFKVSLFITFADKLIFEFLLTQSLDLSVYLSKPFVFLNAIVNRVINNQSTVMVIALI